MEIANIELDIPISRLHGKISEPKKLAQLDANGSKPVVQVDSPTR